MGTRQSAAKLGRVVKGEGCCVIANALVASAFRQTADSEVLDAGEKKRRVQRDGVLVARSRTRVATCEDAVSDSLLHAHPLVAVLLADQRVRRVLSLLILHALAPQPVRLLVVVVVQRDLLTIRYTSTRLDSLTQTILALPLLKCLPRPAQVDQGDERVTGNASVHQTPPQ